MVWSLIGFIFILFCFLYLPAVVAFEMEPTGAGVLTLFWGSLSERVFAFVLEHYHIEPDRGVLIKYVRC